MNEFIIEKDLVLTPDQMVRGVLGISMAKLIEAIRENRDGQYDNLYKPAQVRHTDPKQIRCKVDIAAKEDTR